MFGRGIAYGSSALVVGVLILLLWWQYVVAPAAPTTISDTNLTMLSITENDVTYEAGYNPEAPGLVRARRGETVLWEGDFATPPRLSVYRLMYRDGDLLVAVGEPPTLVTLAVDPETGTTRAVADIMSPPPAP